MTMGTNSRVVSFCPTTSFLLANLPSDLLSRTVIMPEASLFRVSNFFLSPKTVSQKLELVKDM